MSDSDGKVLAGLARSIDRFFLDAGHPPLGSAPVPVADAPVAVEEPDEVVIDSGDAGALGLGAFGALDEVSEEMSLVEDEADALVLEPAADDDDDTADTVEMEALTLDGFDTHVGGGDAVDLPELEVVETPVVGEADAEAALDAEADVAPPPLPTDTVASSHGSGVEDAADGEDDDFVPTPLDLAVDAYLDGDTDKADEIDTLGREHMASHDVEAVARSIERLVLAAGEPRDAAMYAVAHSLMYPLALDRVVRHMGLERDENRRRDFYQICRSIGEPITPAIVNELGETNTDRLARRIYCEALTEMGPAGRKTIREMVESDNQFLVRNAVSILGDHGGDGAVEMVTSALGNPDRRVRREALKALAKLGDEASGEVVIGFLEDPDEKVRLAAAVACGELNVGRALRPLVTMLEETKDPDKAILLIRALGHLGDPGAVLSLEKHAVRTMFSRPRTDVRIAAYRALHQIGTPKTRQMLLEVAKDKDEDVKDAVKKMLYG